MIGAVLLVAAAGLSHGPHIRGLSGASRQPRGRGVAPRPSAASDVSRPLRAHRSCWASRVYLVLPAAAVRVIFKDNLAAGFDFRGVIRFVRENLGQLPPVPRCLHRRQLPGPVRCHPLLCRASSLPIFWAYLTLGYALGDTVRAEPRLPRLTRVSRQARLAAVGARGRSTSRAASMLSPPCRCSSTRRPTSDGR